MRELTLKEINTATLLAELETIKSKPVMLMVDEWRVEDIERELEERNEEDWKVSRW